MDRLRLVAVDWSSIGIGAAIALVSAVAIAWFFFWLQQRRASPRLAYQIRHTLVVGSSRSATSQIEIRYRGTVVPRVTRSEVVIWNAGHATFDGKNAAENDPPRVAVAGGAKVLDAAITRTTRDVINAEFDLTARPNDVDYTFDFLDPRDGFTLDILHSGDDRSVAVAGTYRGLPGGLIRRTPDTNPPRLRYAINAVVPMGVVFFAALQYATFFARNATINIVWVLLVAMVAVVAAACRLIWIARTDLPTRLRS